MTSKHTPGPWEVGQPRTIFPVGNRSMAVAWTSRDRPEHDANAALIAAAPDLLEALKAIVAAWESVSLDVQVPDEINDNDLWAAASAAIAKAEGRS